MANTINVDKISIDINPRKTSTRLVTEECLSDELKEESVHSITVDGSDIVDRDAIRSIISSNPPKPIKIQKYVQTAPSETFIISRKSLIRKGKASPNDVTFDGFTEDPNFTFFIGSFKVGKTKISRDVCKSLNPEFHKTCKTLDNLNRSDPVINTTGEILIGVGGSTIREVIVDTEGLNQVVKTKHSSFIKQFIVEHSIKFGSTIFYVIEKFTPEELTSVYLFLSQIKTHNPVCRFILIHNIRSIKDRNDLERYIRIYFANYTGLFVATDGKTKALNSGELFTTTNLGSDISFEEIFCCSEEDDSYSKMIERVSNIIKNGKPRCLGDLPKTLTETINKILESQTTGVKSELKEFKTSYSIDVDEVQYNPVSLNINERHRRVMVKVGQSRTVAYEYVISVPECTRNPSEIKIFLKGVTIQIEVMVYDYFRNAKKPETFRLFEGLIIATPDSVEFTNNSLRILENCAFRFLVRSNESYELRHQNLVEVDS